ncbi:MAG: energy transducer TonB [Pirellulaceae bacterium]|nr:energy transducer TonB [Pirellulaceae bacterium]
MIRPIFRRYWYLMESQRRIRRVRRVQATLSLMASAGVHGLLYGATLAWLLWLPDLVEPNFAGQRNAIQISAVWSVESPAEAVEIAVVPTPVEVTPTTAQIEQQRLRLESGADRHSPEVQRQVAEPAEPTSEPRERVTPQEFLAAIEFEVAAREKPPATVQIVASLAEIGAIEVESAVQSEPVPSAVMADRQETAAAADTEHQPSSTPENSVESAPASATRRSKPSPDLAAEPARTESALPARRPASTAPSSASVAVAPQELGIDPTIPPSFAGNRPPNYPALAQQRGWEGTVLLRLAIASDGRVTSVEIARSSGYDLLDAEAVAAVRTWRGTPARRGGQAVATHELLPVWFRLR